ncbi:MAG: hypothetical protein KHX53_01620 [Bacteroides sp.]|nr:hypothetical protein [Bacteroides sp.]
MGNKNRQIKRENYEKREAEKANRLFKMICIALLLLAVLTIVGFTLAS